jgi:hypothetical protein
MLNPYFAQMHLASFIFHYLQLFFFRFQQCPFVKELKKSIDPFETMFHQSPPSLIPSMLLKM